MTENPTLFFLASIDRKYDLDRGGDRSSWKRYPIPIGPIESELLARERQPDRSGDFTKMENNPELEDDLRPEYDFSQMKDGVKGKYVDRYRAGTNLVLLDPDVAEAFPTGEAVNEALRSLMRDRRLKPNYTVERTE